MKYVNTIGTLCVSSKKNGKFVDFMTAVMACNAVQIFYASHGFSVHSDVYKKTMSIEVRIHFYSFVMPSLPDAYLFSSRVITSHAFDGYNAKPGERVRVVTYYFEF